MPNPNENNQNSQQEENQQNAPVNAGVVEEQHVDQEPQAGEVNPVQENQNEINEQPRTEVNNTNDQPEANSTNAQPQVENNNPQVTIDSVTDAINSRKEKELAERKKQEQILEGYNVTIAEQEQVLDMLKKRQESLKEYKTSQAELLKKRENEIGSFLYENRQHFTGEEKEKLPADLNIYDELLKTDETKHREMHKRIDEVIDKEKALHDKSPMMAEKQKLKVKNLDGLLKLNYELDEVRKAIEKDGPDACTGDEWTWFKKNTFANKVNEKEIDTYLKNDITGIQNDYEKAKGTYQAAVGLYEKDERGSQQQEFEFYQTLCARRMVLKQAIKNAAMGPEKEGKPVENFTSFDKLAKKDLSAYKGKKVLVEEQLQRSAFAGNKELTDLGYDSVTAGNALNDYYELENKVNSYKARITEQIKKDKATADNKKDTTLTKDQKEAIGKTAKARENWLDSHESITVETYFKKDGSPKKDIYKDMKELAGKYDPKKDQIAKRDELNKTMRRERFEYYRAAQTQLLYQKLAINTAIKKANDQIDIDNKVIRANKKEETQWNSQEACDKKFIEDTKQKAGEATSKRRKMMIGSTVTRFAAKLSNAVGNSVAIAGTTVAEGIVKGERVQVENDLKTLQDTQDRKQQTATALLFNSAKDMNDAEKIDKDDSKKNHVDIAFMTAQAGNDKIMKAVNASSAHMDLNEKIKAKEDELVTARETEKNKLDKIEKEISEEKTLKNNQKLEQNRLQKYENNLLSYNTELQNARNTFDSLKVEGDQILSKDVMNDFDAARNEAKSQKLDDEVKKINKEQADLEKQMKTMQEYSDKLSKYLTPDNMGKVDTIVGIAETLYGAYSSVSKYLEDKEEAKEQEAEQKAVQGVADSLKEQSDAAKKANDDKKADELKEKSDAVANAAKKYEKEDDPFELNVMDTIKDLKEKAQSINESMKGGNEDKETIVQMVTDLTLEAGKIVQIVSQKIDGIASGMEVAYEEAKARETESKDFLESAQKSTASPVSTALDDIKVRQEAHEKFVEREMAAVEKSIADQEKAVKNTKDNRDAHLNEMGDLEKFRLEERMIEREIAEKKLEEDIKKAEKDEVDTEDIRNVRKELESAKNIAADAESNKKTAERNLASAEGTKKLTEKQLAEKEHLVQVWKDEQKKNEEQVKSIQNDNEKYKSQKDKNDAYLKLRQADADKANSAIKKAAVISFFVGLANSTAQNAKGFLDQLTVGAAESVVKGRVYQMENELKELENNYRLKGETALAKDGSRIKHLKKAEEIRKNNLDFKNNPEYKKEQDAAVEDDNRSKELQNDRAGIKKQIEEKQKELAKARVEEAKQLEDLHQKLREQYKVNPEADALDIEIKTNANKLVADAAKKKMQEFEAQNAEIADIFTSPAFLEADAAQRLVIKEEVKNKSNEKDVEKKAEKLENYSNTLKKLFTPKNMSRIDTVVSAAETIVGLYGSVKNFVTGGGGDDKEDEDSKSIADKIADMKEKATNVRKGMMEDGGDKEKEQTAVENVLDITQSLREITENIAQKIEKYAKEYDDVLDDQRQIKMHADNEVKAYKDIFNDTKNKNLTLEDAFKLKRGGDAERIQKSLDESIDLSRKAVKNSEKPIEEAAEKLNAANEEYARTQAEVDNVQKKLDHLVDIEKAKRKGEALGQFRRDKHKHDPGNLAFEAYGDDLNALFPKTQDEVIAEVKQEMRAEAQKQFDELEKKTNSELASKQKELDEQKAAFEAKLKEIEEQQKKIAEQQKKLEEQQKKINGQNEQLDQHARQADQQRQQAEAQRQQAEAQRQQAEAQRRSDNEAKMEKLHDILDNLNDTNNAYFGHTNSKEYDQVRKHLYDFVTNKAENISFAPDRTEKLQTALTKYLDHVGMGVASHRNGEIRKENVLAALNLINPEKAHDYEVKASVKRDGKKDSVQIDLKTLMDKDTVKRTAPRRQNVVKVGAPSKDIEGPRISNPRNNRKA